MASFQKIVILCAVVILLISLVCIGVALKKSVNTQWPPIVPDCPDYWISENSQCVNVKDLGVCSPASGQKHLTMNFNESPYTGTNANCAKYTWANRCQVSWDGINYGVNSPC